MDSRSSVLFQIKNDQRINYSKYKQTESMTNLIAQKYQLGGSHIISHGFTKNCKFRSPQNISLKKSNPAGLSDHRMSEGLFIQYNDILKAQFFYCLFCFNPVYAASFVQSFTDLQLASRQTLPNSTNAQVSLINRSCQRSKRFLPESSFVIQDAKYSLLGTKYFLR